MKPRQPLQSIKSALTLVPVPIKPVEVRASETALAIAKRGNPGPSSTKGRVKSIDPAEVLKFIPTERRDWSFNWFTSEKERIHRQVMSRKARVSREERDSKAEAAGKAAALALLAELGISTTEES